MTTSTTLIQRAAELVIAFGLKDTSMHAAGVYAMAREETIMVTWCPPCERGGRTAIELVVMRLTASLGIRVNVDASGMYPADARRVLMFAGRVAELAERIEALR